MSTTTTEKVKNPCQVVTGVVRLSYEHIWEPSAAPGSTEKKYSGSLIISKDDPKTLKAIRDAVNAAKEIGKDKKWGGKIPPKLKLPLRDGDEDRPEDEAYQNSFFVNANNKTKPGIVNKNIEPILDQSEVYSGCYVRASLTFYAFDSNGSKGVACSLNHIMKVKDGDALGGRTSAENDFAEVADLEDDDLL